jgi:hypothetical protein
MGTGAWNSSRCAATTADGSNEKSRPKDGYYAMFSQFAVSPKEDLMTHDVAVIMLKQSEI